MFSRLPSYSNRPLTIGLLESDVLYDDLIEDYVSYGEMFKIFFKQVEPAIQWQYRHYNIQQDEWPRQINECDAYLITGSKSAAYDSDDWVIALQEWIRQAYSDDVPLIGVCFGHQILAKALGGYVEKSPRGWGVGVRKIPLVIESAIDEVSNRPSTIKLIYSHQDQVTRLPSEAIRLLGDAFCPIAAFHIPRKIVSFQGHPEFTADYLRRLLPRRRDSIGSDRLDNGLMTLKQETDATLVGKWIMQFISDSVTRDES